MKCCKILICLFTVVCFSLPITAGNEYRDKILTALAVEAVLRFFSPVRHVDPIPPETPFLTDYRVVRCSGFANNCFFQALRNGGVDILRSDVTELLERHHNNPRFQRAVNRIAAQELLTTNVELSEEALGWRRYLEQHPEEAIASLSHGDVLYRWFVEHLRNNQPMPFERDGQAAEGEDLIELLGQHFGFDIQIWTETGTDRELQAIRTFRNISNRQRRKINLLYHSTDIGHFDYLSTTDEFNRPLSVDVMDYFPHIIGREKRALYTEAKNHAQGSFGEVFSVFNRGTQYAAKFMSADNFDEIEIQQALKSPFCVRLVEYFMSLCRSYYLLILDWADSGDVSRLCKSNQVGDYELGSAMTQILLGLDYMHRQGFVHRDIKPANLLISSRNCIQICDFGLSEKIEQMNRFAGELRGSPYYLAPEVWMRMPLDHKVDIWSLGVSFYRLIFIRRPFEAASKRELARKVVEDFPRFDISHPFNAILQRMLHKNPRQRPSARELLNDPIVQLYLTILAHLDFRIPREHQEIYTAHILPVNWQSVGNANSGNPPIVLAVVDVHETWKILMIYYPE